MTNNFTNKLKNKLLTGISSYQISNTDKLRYCQKKDLVTMAKDKIIEMCSYLLNKLNFVRINNFQLNTMNFAFANLIENIDGLSWLYERLSDEKSRETLVEVIAFRILGNRHIRLSTNNSKYSDLIDTLTRKNTTNTRAQKFDVLDGWLGEYTISNNPKKITLVAHKLNILNTFLLEQYAYRNVLSCSVETEEGDIVLDGGGCFGDTALYFADKTGANGEVHVFEFSPKNLNIMERNLDKNPHLKSIIKVNKNALWKNSDEKLNFSESGPGTSLLNSTFSKPFTANTISIDDWAKINEIKKIDFIKLDIEGAEEACLLGSRHVIQTYKPKLAVALYHSLEDFVKLPKLIDSYYPDYKFYLGHFTIHSEETILFATK